MKETENFIFFYTNWLSNFHIAKFIDPNSGLPFDNTEQAFMWYKADFFKDGESRKALSIWSLHPKYAKQLGREVKNYNETTWECVRFGYMVYVNYLKYSQNPELRQKLLNTGNKELAEASPIDLIWGIGLSEKEDESKLINKSNWTGRNLLGESLMKVRSLL